MSKEYLNETKLIRAKRRITETKSINLAYVMLKISAEISNDEDVCSIDIIPLIKKETDSGVTYERDSSLSSLTNRFSAKADFSEQKLYFFSGDLLVLSKQIRGLGIGSYAFSYLINWASTRFPDFVVERIKFRFSDIRDQDERERLHSFYENFGFEFEMDSENNGDYVASLCSTLKTHYNKNKIDELDIMSFLGQLLTSREQLETRVSNLEAQIGSEQLYKGKYNKDTLITTLFNVVGILLFVIALVMYNKFF